MLRFGAVFLTFGGLGSVAGGALAAHWRTRGRADANRRVALLGLALLLPFATAVPLLRNGGFALAALAPVMFLIAFPSGAAAAAVQEVAPPRFRGRTIALYYATMNIVGPTSGALLVALLAERAIGGPHALGTAMSVAGLALLLPAVAFAALARRR